MDTEKALEMATAFGPYQLFLLVVLLCSNVTYTCNIVFMVFGAAESVYNESVPVNNSFSIEKETWVFYSFIPEWDLRGSQSWIPFLMTSTQLCGALVGALLGGFLSDHFGRKTNTWLALALISVFGAVSSLCPSWQLMTFFRFLVGFSTGSYESTVQILLMEWINARARLAVQTCLMCINSIGFVWLALLAYLCQTWKLLLLVCGLQGIPCVLAFWWVLESPRWLLLHNKEQKAQQVLKQVCSWNRIRTDFSTISSSPSSSPRNDSPGTDKSSFLELFRSLTMLRFILMVMYSYFVTGTVGYVFIFNTGNLLGTIYFNFALLGSVNVLAALITVVGDHFFQFGRRALHQISLNGVWLCLGVMAALYMAQITTRVPSVLILAALIGSMFSFPLWTVSAVYSAELFPTRIRNKSSALGVMSTYLGGIIAPQILYLFKTWQPLPFLLTAVFTIINVFLAFFCLPETRGEFNEAQRQGTEEQVLSPTQTSSD